MKKAIWLGLCAVSAALSQTKYMQAPESIRKILSAPAPPAASLNPRRDHVLLLDRETHPPIGELAKPMLRLAGYRINPLTNGPHRGPTFLGATLVALAGGTRTRLAFPPGARIATPDWGPRGDRFATAVTFDDRVELWLGETAGGAVKSVPGVRLNAATADPIVWAADGKTLIVRLVPAERGPAPEPPEVPSGPNVQEAAGKPSDTWTFQDLLSSAHDEDLFDYYATSQLARVDEKGAVTPIGRPAIFQTVDPSPDGMHLLVSYLRRPYSWLYPAEFFPLEIEIWSARGTKIRTIASLPLADHVSADGVRTGPRRVQWKPDEPSVLVWAEALDGGNPREKTTHRDRIMTSRPPFTTPREWHRVEHRFVGYQWTAKGAMLVSEYDRDRRWIRTSLVARGSETKVIDDRSIRDRYKDTGTPLMNVLPSGKRVILQDGEYAYFSGPGATPQGDRPFLDRVHLATLEKERIFQSEAGVYEAVLAVLEEGGSRLLTRRESAAEPPNLYVYEGGRRSALTEFRDPAPELRGGTKELVTYQRPDGVPLSFTLYLPPGYQKGTRLPALLWAYPREFTDTATAGQVSTTANRFTLPSGSSHLFLLLAGYAILDDASLPVVGDAKTANNTYIEQIVAGAKAAIDKAAQMGVVDPNRVAVSGHSYGAFMTANLLAHSDLFRAGVARSGAYNRTLTPFGFQAERRTFWEAPDIYFRISPFTHANQINEPLLLIHGEADNNAGTFPMQSERMYHAIRGNGGTVRLVMLPHESHGYAARESVEHVIAETMAWLDKHVKNAPRR